MCELEAREPAGVPVSERLAEPPHVIARTLHQPVADAAMNANALLIGDLSRGSRPDQVVSESQHAAGFDDDPTRLELARRPLGPLPAPPTHVGPLRRRDRPRADRR